ncbi:MAG: hypothetical protein AB1757_17785 [Acidobacteriota bacterium]
MQLEYVPLLKIQRELYESPRGMERFEAYIKTMVDAETRDLKLPLSSMNPMGKDHLPKLLDEYLAFHADELAAQSVEEAEANLTNIDGKFKVTLVLSDDLMGGWTNRYTVEFGHRSGSAAYFKRGWFTGMLWTSLQPTPELVRREVLITVYRGAHIVAHGFATTLGGLLAQEGYAMAMANCQTPTLDADDLAYTEEIISPFLDSKDYPILLTCLFGDEAAKALGYAPMGLSRNAGLALTLSQTKKKFG